MRALKLALLILALVPTVWLRGIAPVRAQGGAIQLVDLMPALGRSQPDTGALQLLGAWQIRGLDRNLSTLSSLA
ncbi:hypothetical protein [Novosphingobium sp. PASSN1]|uniref:hypothetical protein n=1 Tax=Novosphingobium sp. PASSN1 TaxID=2015561 RepID=UPI0025DF3502|nr:hypothetical protein [Novosphingobium sp. PASSN1]